MSITQKRIGLLALLGVTLIAILKFHVAQSPGVSVLFTPGSGDETSASKSTSIEAYRLDRKIKAVVYTNQSEKTILDLTYSTSFYLYWVYPNLARVAFAMSDGMKSTVGFEMSVDHGRLVQINAEPVIEDRALEMVGILKDFASLYAYRAESDPTGQYRAEWVESERSLLKKKTEYTSEENRRIRILSSRHRYRLKPGTQELFAAEGFEVTEIPFGKDGKMRTTSEYALTSIPIPSALPLAQTVLQAPVQTTTLLVDQKVKKHFTPWSEIETRLQAFAALSSGDRLQLFHDVGVTLAEDPAHRLPEFQSWAEAHLMDPSSRAFSVGVMATDGSADAQKALTQWFQQFPESHALILNAFATSAAVFTPETQKLLESMVDQHQDPDAAYSAAFAMGAGLRNASSGSSADTSAVRAKLQELFTQATSIEEKVIYLDAIGNSGSSQFLPLLQQSLTANNDEAVREKATLAMRFMPASLTRALLALAESDPSARVKAAAVQVAQYQRSSND